MKPFQLVARVHRKYCDLNRAAEKVHRMPRLVTHRRQAYEDPNMAHYYNRYHNGITAFIEQARKVRPPLTPLALFHHACLVDAQAALQLSPIGRVLLIDMHGQSYMKGHVLRGTQDGARATMSRPHAD